jgi:hypothetical protein
MGRRCCRHGGWVLALLLVGCGQTEAPGTRPPAGNPGTAIRIIEPAPQPRSMAALLGDAFVRNRGALFTPLPGPGARIKPWQKTTPRQRTWRAGSGR